MKRSNIRRMGSIDRAVSSIANLDLLSRFTRSRSQSHKIKLSSWRSISSLETKHSAAQDPRLLNRSRGSELTSGDRIIRSIEQCHRSRILLYYLDSLDRDPNLTKLNYPVGDRSPV